MKGPLRRILPARRPPDPEPAPEAPQDVRVTIVESTASIEPLPAGVAAGDAVDVRPSFRDRGRLRRRLRYLRSVRELGFRDLGGLVFDLHRFRRRNDELVVGKLAALEAVDRELRAIERVLDERRDLIELREPGVSACPRCGALHGSEARFCPQCGTQLSGPVALGAAVGGPAAGAPATAPPAPGATAPTAVPVPPPAHDPPTQTMAPAGPARAPERSDVAGRDNGAAVPTGDPVGRPERRPDA
jgi:hypothetical protein